MEHPLYNTIKNNARPLPDKAQVGIWTDEFFKWLFAIGTLYADKVYLMQKGQELEAMLKQQLILTGIGGEKSAAVIIGLNKDISGLYNELQGDLDAIFEFDPAAKSREEVLLTYPGFFAVAVYRIAHRFWNAGIPILHRMMSEYVHGRTGIDIHPGAQIGERFFIDHGTGIVIGETTVIGHDVRLYQGVTLGALSVSKADAEVKRHPTIGHNVTIYANATILGGETVIGDNSVIGGNVWITHSVPPHSLVYHKSEITIKTKQTFPEPLNFVI